MLTSLEYLASRRMGGNRFNMEDYTARGLEIMTNDPALKQRQRNDKLELKRAIVAESARQKEMKANGDTSVPNLDNFCAISQKYTRSSRDRALFLGQSDERACRPKGDTMIGGVVRMATQTLRRRGSGVTVLRTEPHETQRRIVSSVR
jgi:hypothetical protein